VSYSRQLAKAIRDKDLEAHPELSARAAVFGVGPARRVTASSTPPSIILPAESESRVDREWPILPPPLKPSAEEPSRVSNVSAVEPVMPSAESVPTRPVGLEGRILSLVAEKPGIRLDALAVDLGVGSAEASAALRVLVEAGRVLRKGVGRWSKFKLPK
jgi:hypothetical protein